MFVAGSLALTPLLGRDFFPSVDAGLIKLHIRVAPGTRIEETEKQILAIERTIRTLIPPDQIDTLLDIVGTPYSSINLSLSEGALVSAANSQILISLKPGHAPTEDYLRALRKTLRHDYPDDTFFFLAPDISTQVLNFGLAAPIDLQVVGPIGSEDTTEAFATALAKRVTAIQGAVDVHLAQEGKVPQLKINFDRTEAIESGRSRSTTLADRPPDLAGVESGNDGARVLGRSAQRAVRRRGPDAAIQDRLGRSATRHADLDGEQAAVARQHRPDPARDRRGEHHALQRRADVGRAGERRGQRISAPSAIGSRRSSPT